MIADYSPPTREIVPLSCPKHRGKSYIPRYGNRAIRIAVVPAVTPIIAVLFVQVSACIVLAVPIVGLY
jgi:hypothetical protein